MEEIVVEKFHQFTSTEEKELRTESARKKEKFSKPGVNKQQIMVAGLENEHTR